MDEKTLRRLIISNTPTRTKSIDYLAMLLGYHPYYFTHDRVEEKKIYGDKFKKHQIELAMVVCDQLLKIPSLSNNPKLLKVKALYDSGRKTEAITFFRTFEKDIKSGGKSAIDVNHEFTYFRGYVLSPDLPPIHIDDVKYRLYINIGIEGRALFTKKFIEKCEQKGIPYYFKVYGRKEQTDTVVIYVDTLDHLVESVNAINEIYNDPKDKRLRMCTKGPAPHLARVNSVIGYGFEPKSGGSFTTIMQGANEKIAAKKESLKAKMEEDFKSGRRYISQNQPNIRRPSIEEMREFKSLSQEDKLEFFRKYADYIFMSYGKEIREIYSFIDQEMVKERKFIQKDVDDDDGER